MLNFNSPTLFYFAVGAYASTSSYSAKAESKQVQNIGPNKDDLCHIFSPPHQTPVTDFMTFSLLIKIHVSYIYIN